MYKSIFGPLYQELPRFRNTPGFRRRIVIHRMLSHFRVVEHVVPCQHTRQYLAATEPGHELDLKLAVKQYVPKTQTQRRLGDVTVIGAHANGFPKELYEPLWDDLYERLNERGQGIRSIWIADLAQQGQSGIINETILGNEPSWLDHARDLLFLINQKQKEMPQPLVGIGHSIGGTQLAYLALMHPRLLQGLILIDPVIQIPNPSKEFAIPSTYRRDVWSSREEARRKFLSNTFYQTWDPRIFDKWIEFGLRDLPTEQHPEAPPPGSDKPVTLATPKSQEVFTFLRPTYRGNPDLPPEEDMENYSDLRHTHFEPEFPFYRWEPGYVYRKLPELHPSTLYIVGKRSPLNPPELHKARLSLTGTAPGGNGGVKYGRVEGAALDCGHFVPMEKTQQTADMAATFVQKEVSRWQRKAQDFRARWKAKSRLEQVTLDDEWREKIGQRPARPENNDRTKARI